MPRGSRSSSGSGSRSRSRRRGGGRTMSARQRLWLGVFLGVVLVLVVGAFFGYARMRAWLRSGEFRLLLEQEIGEVAQGEVSMEPLQWDGWEAFSQRMEVVGESQAGYERVLASGVRVRARPSGLLRGAYELPTVELDRLQLWYSMDGMGADVGADGAEREGDLAVSGDVAEGAEGGDGGEGDGFLAGLLPQQVRVEQVLVSRFDLMPLEEDGLVTLSRVRLEVEQGAPADHYVARAEGGLLELPVLPDFELRELRARVDEQAVYVQEAVLIRNGLGQMRADGQLGLVPERETDLRLQLEQLPLDSILPDSWVKRLDGQVESELVFQTRAERAWLQGEVRVNGGAVTLLPVLDRLADYFESERLRQVRFDEARADVLYEDGKLVISNLVLHGHGLMRVEGVVALEDGELDGVIALGFSSSLMRKLPQAEQAVFDTQRDGMHWTQVRLSGPLDDLEEDLSKRLLLAATNRLTQWLPEGVRPQMLQSGEVRVGNVSLLGGDEQDGNIVTRAGGALLDSEGRDGLMERGGEFIRSGGDAVGTGVDSVREGARDVVDYGTGLLDGLRGRGGDGAEADEGSEDADGGEDDIENELPDEQEDERGLIERGTDLFRGVPLFD